mmetsp:Transcript_7455/g.9305  ORF Transcript_7455/g.9305 Transcript_7455/m.9305 type:complete len:90 (-) Transcript_7455:336-605(-)
MRVLFPVALPKLPTKGGGGGDAIGIIRTKLGMKQKMCYDTFSYTHKESYAYMPHICQMYRNLDTAPHPPSFGKSTIYKKRTSEKAVLVL